MYVSKGIGTSILPFRFGARAEVAVFDSIRIKKKYTKLKNGSFLIWSSHSKP